MTQHEPGRNDPCPCGSGKKYKQCHLAVRDAAAGDAAKSQRIHDRDRELNARMWRFGESAYPDLWPDPAAIDDEELQFSIPYFLYHERFEGTTPAALFREAARLTADERAWMDAQFQAWLSIWEIESVTAGVGVSMRDVLTGERRDIVERRASQALVPGHHVLARVVDFDGASYVCGSHPNPLRPLHAAEVLDHVRRRLGVKQRVSPRRLRRFGGAQIVASEWIAMLLLLEDSQPPQLTTSHGDPFVMVTDRFTFAAEEREGVLARLSKLPGVDRHRDELLVLREGILLGSIDVGKTSMRCQTFALTRADTLRALIEEACGDVVRFRARDIVDPMSHRAAKPEPVERPPATREQQEVVRQIKQKHYEAWLDETIPALGGLTPHEAAKSKEGRALLDVLLRDIAFLEAKLPAAERFDVSFLRRALGLK